MWGISDFWCHYFSWCKHHYCKGKEEVVQSLCFVTDFVFFFRVDSAMCAGSCKKLCNEGFAFFEGKKWVSFATRGRAWERQREETALWQFCSRLHFRPHKGTGRFLELNFSYRLWSYLLESTNARDDQSLALPNQCCLVVLAWIVIIFQLEMYITKNQTCRLIDSASQS